MHIAAIILTACITIPENPGYCDFAPSWQQQQLYDDQQDNLQQQRDALDAIQQQQDNNAIQQIINQPRIDPNAYSQ
jgi:hypothetical protein